MCLYGTYKIIKVINPIQLHKNIKVDACISDELQWLNDSGIVTLNSCCGHGNAGHPVVIENSVGKWKEYQSPPIVLIDKESVGLAKELNYKPFPYNGTLNNGLVWQMFLKSGCVTIEDCREWHSQHAIPYQSNLGVIST
ncbi:hypothetical protein [Cytobacillus dafuensis]|uniref:Uncharacterized protein n=1 Tax=Cytobacillus dafuensis TaxID=1742359 RepID=A0A5B8Z3L5_CYTDA|nr:hypothetical protein [Cytobacillus dafuensis]QED46883.1 hypothetical protein FSZ17_06150 [Cytobacillus dafuensis]